MPPTCATNTVSDLTTAATQATIFSLAANSADSVNIVVGGTTRIDLSAKPVDLDGNFRFTANGATSGDIVSITVISGDATAVPFSVTGDSPGVATGGSIIISLGTIGASSSGPTTITTTYRRFSTTQVAATTLTMASALTNAEAKAAAGWNGKIPRDAGLARATPAADGTYNGEDLTVVVDGRTLSSADYSFSIAGANAHFLLITNVTAQNTPNAAANNVIVSLKYTEFDGSILGGATSIPTPFGTVTATAGPSFATQQTIPVVAATSITGFADGPGTVRIANLNLNTVVKITFQYDVIDSAAKLATVSTPTSVGAGKSRSPTGTESGPNSNTFTFKVATLTVDDINTIDTAVAALVAPNDTINNLVAALATKGSFNTRIGTIATGGSGLGLGATSSASAFAALLVPIRGGETVTVTYTDADADAGSAATLTNTATVDLAAPTITINKPTDNSFAGDQTTLQVTINDSGAGLKLTDVAGNLRTNPQVSGTIVASSTLASSAEYSLSETAAPIPEGATSMWVGNNNGVLKDAVGNAPSGSGATQGTDATLTRGTRGNTFQFTVDKAPPTLSRAITGGKLDTDPTSDTVNQIIADSTAKDAISVELDLGVGGAPVNADSVSHADGHRRDRGRGTHHGPHHAKISAEARGVIADRRQAGGEAGGHPFRPGS